MKNYKWEQVFTGNTDDILADKIIKHTEINSKKDSSTVSENKVRQHRFTKKHIAIAIAALSSIILLFMLIVGFKKRAKK